MKHLEAYDSDWRKKNKAKELAVDSRSEKQNENETGEPDQREVKEASGESKERRKSDRRTVQQTTIAKATTEMTTTTTTSTSSLVITKKTFQSDKPRDSVTKDTIDSYLLTHILKEVSLVTFRSGSFWS